LLIIVIKDLNVPNSNHFPTWLCNQAINLMREPYLNFRYIAINTHIHSHTKRYNNIYYNRLINKVTLSFTPYPLFQWYPQTNEILLNLSMKCWNSAFNAQGSKIIIMVVQVGAVKIYVAAVEALRKKGKTGWNSMYHQNWWENQKFGSQLFCFVRFSFPLTRLMAYYAETARSRPLFAWLYG
jgi:hypothetical protein